MTHFVILSVGRDCQYRPPVQLNHDGYAILDPPGRLGRRPARPEADFDFAQSSQVRERGPDGEARHQLSPGTNLALDLDSLPRRQHSGAKLMKAFALRLANTD